MQELTADTDGNTDVVAYLQMQKFVTDATKFDRSASQNTLKFWEILLADPDLNRLNRLSIDINKSMSRALCKRV